jgi:hypothetical protein
VTHAIEDNPPVRFYMQSESELFAPPLIILHVSPPIVRRIQRCAELCQKEGLEEVMISDRVVTWVDLEADDPKVRQATNPRIQISSQRVQIRIYDENIGEIDTGAITLADFLRSCDRAFQAKDGICVNDGLDAAAIRKLDDELAHVQPDNPRPRTRSVS